MSVAVCVRPGGQAGRRSLMGYQWDFSPVWRNAGPLIEGLGNTLWLSGWSILPGLVLGLILALLRLSPSRVASIGSLMVIEFYRNTPPRFISSGTSSACRS